MRQLPTVLLLSTLLAATGCSKKSGSEDGAKDEGSEGNAVLAAIANCKKSGTAKSCETAALWSYWTPHGVTSTQIFDYASKACTDDDKCIALGAVQLLSDWWTKKLDKDGRYAEAEKTLRAGCKKAGEGSDTCLLHAMARQTTGITEKVEEACVKGDGTWGCLFYFEGNSTGLEKELLAWSKKACKAGFAPACSKGADAEKEDETRVAAWEKGCSLNDPKGCSLAARAYESEKLSDPAKAKKLKAKGCELTANGGLGCKK